MREVEKLGSKFVLIFSPPCANSWVFRRLYVFSFFRFPIAKTALVLICTLFCIFGFEEAFLWIIISHDDDDDDVQRVLGVTGFLLRHC